MPIRSLIFPVKFVYQKYHVCHKRTNDLKFIRYYELRFIYFKVLLHTTRNKSKQMLSGLSSCADVLALRTPLNYIVSSHIVAPQIIAECVGVLKPPEHKSTVIQLTFPPSVQAHGPSPPLVCTCAVVNNMLGYVAA